MQIEENYAPEFLWKKFHFGSTSVDNPSLLCISPAKGKILGGRHRWSIFLVTQWTARKGPGLTEPYQCSVGKVGLRLYTHPHVASPKQPLSPSSKPFLIFLYRKKDRRPCKPLSFLDWP